MDYFFYHFLLKNKEVLIVDSSAQVDDKSALPATSTKRPVGTKYIFKIGPLNYD